VVATGSLGYSRRGSAYNAIPTSRTGQAISHYQRSGIRCQAQQCHVLGFQPQADDATTCAHWSWCQRWCLRVRHMAYW
jgi:hypothetical protein